MKLLKHPKIGLTLLIVLLSYPSFGLVGAKASCQITITNERFSGERMKVKFYTDLKTKAQCKALAQMHRKNFDPEIIKKKTVAYQWKKTKSSMPVLASAPRKLVLKTCR